MHFASLFTEERLVSDRQLTDLFNVVDRIGKLAFEFKHHLLHRHAFGVTLRTEFERGSAKDGNRLNRELINVADFAAVFLQ